MSETRLSGGERDGASQLLASARARLSAALADLALPERLRLSDRERTTVSRLLFRLVREVEDELRSALSERFTAPGQEAVQAALSSAAVPIALPILEAGGALVSADLIALLLRRAEEHRLSRLAPENQLLVELAGDADDAVAADAVSLLVAHSRRLDAFQEPLVAGSELPAEIQHALVWSVAAALRRYLVDHQDIAPAQADEAISAAAAGFLGRYDEGAGIDALSARLARRLKERDRLDDAILAAMAVQGALPLFLAALSVRTAISSHAAWEILSDANGRGPALLLRAAAVERRAAAGILLHLAGRQETAASQLDFFDAVAPAEAARIVALWQLDPAYRAAIARLAA